MSHLRNIKDKLLKWILTLASFILEEQEMVDSSRWKFWEKNYGRMSYNLFEGKAIIKS